MLHNKIIKELNPLFICKLLIITITIAIRLILMLYRCNKSSHVIRIILCTFRSYRSTVFKIYITPCFLHRLFDIFRTRTLLRVVSHTSIVKHSTFLPMEEHFPFSLDDCSFGIFPFPNSWFL